MTTSRNRPESVSEPPNQSDEAAIAWFVRMTSDRVTEDDRRSFEAWLDRDPSHALAYAEAEALWCALGRIADFRTEEASLPPERKSVDRPPQHRWMGRAAALAASLLAIITVGFWMLGGPDRLRADHATAVGETRTVALADGTTVELNTDSALAVDFTEACRCIRLIRGEAFFDVATRPGRPFRVVAGHGLTEALGTAFNVYLVGDVVTVAVAEGQVRVERTELTGPAADGLTLVSGEAARYAAAGPIEVERSDIARLLAWRDGRLIFAERPLREVIAELDRYHRGAILLLDRTIAEARFTGALDLDDTNRALDAIQATLPVDVVRITPWFAVLSPGG